MSCIQVAGVVWGRDLVGGKGNPLPLRILTRSYTHYFCQSTNIWKERLENVVVNLGGHVPT